jgi:cytochrome c553
MHGLLPKIRKQHFITLLLLLLVYAGVVVCSGYSNAISKKGAVTGNFSDSSSYAGAASCINCHKAVYDSFTGRRFIY